MPNPNQLTLERVKRILALKKDGLTLREISKLEQVAVGTVHRYLNLESTVKKRRVAWLRKNYELTEEQYQALYSLNSGGCHICSKKEKVLCVDHNHDTGKVRGLLCHTCNRGIGLLKDDIKVLALAISYLESSRENPTTT